MASDATRFKVGLFLIVGFLLGAAALLWLGASRVWKEYRSYVTYFADSVQGLDVGSPVKFRGVPLGRVSAIRVAPDGNHVEVWMEIDPAFEVRPGLRARLGSVGITGAAFVELEFVGTEAAPSPELPFETPPGTIPSAPSFLTHLSTDVAGLVADLREADLPGLARDLRRLVNTSGLPEAARALEAAADAAARAAQRLERLLGEPALASAVTRADRAAGSLASAADRLDRLLADPALPGLVADLSAAAADARKATQALRAQIEGLDLPGHLAAAEAHLTDAAERVGEAADRAAAAADTARGSAAATARAALLALERVEGAAARVEALARDLDEAPSRLVWEAPPPEETR